MKIYDDEQDKQHDDLEKTFKKINESNKNLKTLVDSKKVDLERDDEILNELGSRISQNEQRLAEDNQLIDNLRDIPNGIIANLRRIKTESIFYGSRIFSLNVAYPSL